MDDEVSLMAKNDEKKNDDRDSGAKDAADQFLAGAAQATLHRESSGRGGRTVTVLTLKPAPAAQAADAIAKAMRKGLGCGSRVEGAKIVLQGDIQERAKAWLAPRGVKKIVMGN